MGHRVKCAGEPRVTTFLPGRSFVAVGATQMEWMCALVSTATQAFLRSTGSTLDQQPLVRARRARSPVVCTEVEPLDQSLDFRLWRRFSLV